MNTQYRLHFFEDGSPKALEKLWVDSEGRLIDTEILAPLSQAQAIKAICELGRRGYQGGMDSDLVSIIEKVES